MLKTEKYNVGLNTVGVSSSFFELKLSDIAYYR